MYQGHPSQYWGPTSYSQHGDDMLILCIFRQLGIAKPSYLDLGAHHPTDISNTRLLYERGCRGFNVEANEVLFKEFLKERPEDININFGVHLHEGLAPFYVFHERDGRNTFSKNEADGMCQGEGRVLLSTRMINVLTLNQIVDRFCNGHFPDLLNCDLEGLDFEVLQAANFYKSCPKVICVETRTDTAAESNMKMMMKYKGFNLYCRMGENLFFVKAGLLPS